MATNEQQASSDWSKADIISLLAPHLPDDLKPQALNVALKLSDPGARVFALFNLASLLPEERRPVAMQEAFETARQIKDSFRRVEALLTIMESLPYDLHLDIVHEAMTAIAEGV